MIYDKNLCDYANTHQDVALTDIFNLVQLMSNYHAKLPIPLSVNDFMTKLVAEHKMKEVDDKYIAELVSDNDIKSEIIISGTKNNEINVAKLNGMILVQIFEYNFISKVGIDEIFNDCWIQIFLMQSKQVTTKDASKLIHDWIALIYYQTTLLGQKKLFNIPDNEYNNSLLTKNKFYQRLLDAIDVADTFDTITLNAQQLFQLLFKLKNKQKLTQIETQFLLAPVSQQYRQKIANLTAFNLKQAFISTFNPIQYLTQINDISILPKNVQIIINKLTDEHHHVNIYHTVNTYINNKRNKHVLWGIHGTSPISVSSILQNGFKTSAELRNQHAIKYRATGAALGDGVYFARLDQFEKAFSYASGRNTNYMFISKLHYNEKKEVTHYGELKLNETENLIWAKGVGSYGRDEIVVKNGYQIETSYLLERVVH